jgi:hypothetical protein
VTPLLDAQGVIRHRNLRDQQMEQAVVTLLDELNAGAGRPVGTAPK